MECEHQIETTVTLKLTGVEASILKAMLQNPVSKNESYEESELREKIFESLKWEF